MHDVFHYPPIDTGSCSEQHVTRHCEISTARGELEIFCYFFSPYSVLLGQGTYLETHAHTGRIVLHLKSAL